MFGCVELIMRTRDECSEATVGSNEDDQGSEEEVRLQRGGSILVRGGGGRVKKEVRGRGICILVKTGRVKEEVMGSGVG